MQRPEGDAIAQHHLVSLNDVNDADLRERIGSVINLMDNTVRGTVAEVLVAKALDGNVTDQWGNWDVTVNDGTRIEVKATGLVQAWEQTKPSKSIWSIAASRDWVLTDHGYVEADDVRRSSDYYVFALHAGARPDQLDEWTFYVVATPIVDEVFGDQKTVSESALRRRSDAQPLTFQELEALTLTTRKPTS